MNLKKKKNLKLKKQHIFLENSQLLVSLLLFCFSLMAAKHALYIPTVLDLQGSPHSVQ